MVALLTVADKLVMIFLLLVVGFGAAKFSIIDSHFVDKLSGFLTKIVVPFFLISSLQISYTPELLKRGAIVFAACIFMHFVSLIIGFATARLFRLPNSAAGVWIYSCMFANIGFMGIPVIGLVLGGDSIFYCTFASFAFNLLSYTFGVVILCKYSDNNGEVKIPIKQILFAPANIGIVIGLVLFILNIRLPSFLGETLSMVGNMITPLAMIYIGAVLTRCPIKDAFKDRWVYVLSLLRLIILPLLGYALLNPFISDRLVMGVVILGLSTPVGTFCAILAGEYGGNTLLASKYILVTTFLCLFTMPFLALLFV